MLGSKAKTCVPCNICHELCALNRRQLSELRTAFRGKRRTRRFTRNDPRPRRKICARCSSMRKRLGSVARRRTQALLRALRLPLP